MKAAFYYYKAYLGNLYKDWIFSRTWFIRYLLKSGLSFFSLFLSSFKLSR